MQGWAEDQPISFVILSFDIELQVMEIVMLLGLRGS